MFARITKYRMKPEMIDDAKAKLDELRPRIMSLPGLITFINVLNDDGNGYVVSVVESEEISNANQEQVAAIWGLFADHLAEPPSPEGYNVIMCESNS